MSVNQSQPRMQRGCLSGIMFVFVRGKATPGVKKAKSMQKKKVTVVSLFRFVLFVTRLLLGNLPFKLVGCWLRGCFLLAYLFFFSIAKDKHA